MIISDIPLREVSLDQPQLHNSYVLEARYSTGAFVVDTDVVSAPQSRVLAIGSLGLTTPEIARLTYNSVHTIKSHRDDLFHRLDAHNMPQLVHRAFHVGMLAVTRYMPDGLDSISCREMEIIENIAEGKSYAETASTLDINPCTVKSHLARIAIKTGLSTGAEKVLAAHLTGVYDAVQDQVTEENVLQSA